MKFDKTFILSFVAPLMILLSTAGLMTRKDNKKFFYFPIGLMGIFIILEKGVSRKLSRNNILKKIKSFHK